MVYGDAHRRFLQVLTSRRAMEEQEARTLQEKCCQEYRAPTESLKNFLEELNERLQVMQLAVRTSVEERKDGDYTVYALVNLMAGEANRSCSSFSRQELAFIRGLVAEIIASETGEVDQTTALNLGLSLKIKMRIGECEQLLEGLVEKGWFLKDADSRDSWLSLSGLVIAELNTYLEETHGQEIHKCFFCTKYTFKGQRCPKCEVMVHNDCGNKFWSSTRPQTYRCPRSQCDAIFRKASATRRHKRQHFEDQQDEDEYEEGEE